VGFGRLVRRKRAASFAVRSTRLARRVLRLDERCHDAFPSLGEAEFAHQNQEFVFSGPQHIVAAYVTDEQHEVGVSVFVDG
jgi:hypothetical protein